MSLEAAVESWIRLANEKNGYDNTSVVATHCRMSPEKLVLFNPAVASAPASAPVSASVSLPPSLPRSLQKSGLRSEPPLPESSKKLLYPETSPAPEPVQQGRSKLPLPLLGLLGLILACGGLGLWVRSLQNQNPDPEQLPPPPETTAPTPADIPSPGADIPSSGAESPSPGAESPSPSPEPTPAEIPAPSPEPTPAEIPAPSPSPEIPPP
jgi:protein phosphatase